MQNRTLVRIRKWLTIRRSVMLGGGLIIVGLGVSGYRLLVPSPKILFPTAPALGITQVSDTKPVKIIFSRPVKASTLRYKIHPALPGRWALNNGWWHGKSTLTFTPSESPDLDTRYTIELTGIQSVLGGHPANYLLSFQTDTIPLFQLVSPATLAVDVLPDAPIVVTFDKALTDSVVVTAVLTPELALEPGTVSGKTITFPHAAQFQKSTGYTLTVSLGMVKRNYRTKTNTVSEEKTDISATTFTTIAAPTVQNYSPGGSGVHPATTIRLEFKQIMDQASTQAALSVSPAISGTFSWEKDVLLVMTPNQPLAKGQTHTVTLANTAKAASGFSPDEAFTWTFTVIGLVEVSAWSPGAGATGVDINSAMKVTFNQDVDHASAESKFSVSPAVNGAFSWSGNVMTFQPAAALAYNQTYTMTVAAGVKTISGLDSTKPFTASFTTRNQSVLLKVPAYRQAYMYSCMIAAARSALAFRGVSASESSIIARVGRDSTPWSGTWGGDNGVWGDPDGGMVGPLNNGAATSPAGKKTTNVYWGYGSHWTPISRALTSYGVGNDVKSGMTVQDLARELTNNNPVIVWWVNGIWPSYEVKWKTPSGKSVRGVNGLHVQVVRGFNGPIDNPTSFVVTDSGYGYPGRTIDIGTFKARWGWFGNTGIVVK